ncbi:unnamed protein product [Hermetia illucens]|uniref:Uncharacterized protein n=1 Tax=Hermetia illucens TaxID=343691 RepID=A0A7R8V0F2_HERIL|nr:unnamed protein product [Hermetia illucens]
MNILDTSKTFKIIEIRKYEEEQYYNIRRPHPPGSEGKLQGLRIQSHKHHQKNQQNFVCNTRFQFNRTDRITFYQKFRRISHR